METVSVAAVTGTEDIVTTTSSQSAEVDGVPVPVSVVHVTIPNQGIQSVIQGQPSVIQTATGQTIQAIQVGEAII